MSDWKVSREQISLSPHPNADKLEVGRLGEYSVVVGKGEYEDGDTVIFVPEKSILPEELAEVYQNYLAGDKKNRVKGIRLRGEPSMGIILDDSYDYIGIGEDISDLLNITEYEPPIPAQLSGKIESFGVFESPIRHHDVGQFTVNRKEFIEGERVIVTEKIHGSQVIIIKDKDDKFSISSKGIFKRGCTILEDDNNSYWKGARSSGAFDLIMDEYAGYFVQVFGELVPCQRGFDYGFKEPNIRIFSIMVNGKDVLLDDVPSSIMGLWVPILYDGKYNDNLVDYLQQLKEGPERVSGTIKHIKEGIVLKPHEDRRTARGSWLQVKLLNSKYKEIGEEIN